MKLNAILLQFTEFKDYPRLCKKLNITYKGITQGSTPQKQKVQTGNKIKCFYAQCKIFITLPAYT